MFVGMTGKCASGYFFTILLHLTEECANVYLMHTLSLILVALQYNT